MYSSKTGRYYYSQDQMESAERHRATEMRDIASADYRANRDDEVVWTRFTTENPNPTCAQIVKYYCPPKKVLLITFCVGVAASLCYMLYKGFHQLNNDKIQSLSADWSDSATSSLSLVSANEITSQKMLKQLGSYLFNITNMVSTLLGVLSSSATDSRELSICSVATTKHIATLREILGSAMHDGGSTIIQNNSDPISCLLIWGYSYPQAFVCTVNPSLKESIFQKSDPINKTECSQNDSPSDKGFIQINLYGSQRNLLSTTNGLPSTYQPTFNCTLYDEYVVNNAIARQLLQCTICNATTLLFNNLNISDSEVAVLAPAIRQLMQLTQLDMRNNNISDVGVVLITEILAQLPNLMNIDFSANNISLAGCANFIHEMGVHGSQATIDC